MHFYGGDCIETHTHTIGKIPALREVTTCHASNVHNPPRSNRQSLNPSLKILGDTHTTGKVIPPTCAQYSKGWDCYPCLLAQHQPIDHLIDGTVTAYRNDPLAAFLHRLAGQFHAVSGSFSAYEAEAQVKLGEQSFDVRLGFLAVAIPGSRV